MADSKDKKNLNIFRFSIDFSLALFCLFMKPLHERLSQTVI